MGAGASAEHFDAHLERQKELITRLDAAVQRSATRLQTAGSLVIDYNQDGDGYPEAENDDARQLLSTFYKKARQLNELPVREGPLDDEEAAQLMQAPEDVARYNEDATVYKPWLSVMRKPAGTAAPDGTLPATKQPTLERVFGFAGSMLRCAQWIDNHTAVYACGGVVVVHDTRNNNTTTTATTTTGGRPQQRFFREHASTVSTIAVHPLRRLVASAELGFLPVIHIWNVDTLEVVCTVADSWRTGIMSLCFSPDGSEIAAVDYSDDHFLGVFNWQAHNMVARASHSHDVFDICFTPAAGAGAASSPGTPDPPPSIVSVGDQHITFWSRDPTGMDEHLIGSPAQLGNAGKRQAFTAVTSATRGVSGTSSSSGHGSSSNSSSSVVVVVGTQAGELYIFSRQQRLVRVLDAQTRLITCLRSVPGTSVVCCAGFDGHVSTWNIASFKKMVSYYIVTSLLSSSPSSGSTGSNNSASDEQQQQSSSAPIQSLDVSPDGKTALVGTTNNTLSSISIGATSGSIRSAGTVLQGGGHLGDSISTLCAHPNKPRAATGGADFRVVEWDASPSSAPACAIATTSGARSLNPMVLRVHRIPAHATSSEYSPDGTQLAVGLSNGAVCIFCGDELTHSFALGKRRVQCVRFSGNGKLLAAGTADNVVEVYDASAGFTHVAQLTGGISGVVINIDFAVNDTVLRACTQSYELVYFDVRKKERLKPEAVDGLLWNTHSALFGWEVQGIWRLDSEFNDVNAVCRSRSKRLLATAETTGLVKVFRYPCIGGGLDENGVLRRRPDSLRLKGHVFNTLGADWLPADAGLVSASPDCILLWKL